MTDGYGEKVFKWSMPDPPLVRTERIVARNHTEDGEHVLLIMDDAGRLSRWHEVHGREAVGGDDRPNERRRFG